MKKKNIPIITIIAILLTLGISFYFLYYFFLLKDDRDIILQGNESIEFDNNYTAHLSIANFDPGTCIIQYCHFNNCTKSLQLSCHNLKENEFEGLAQYSLSLTFRPYPIYPWGEKQYIKSWSIKRINEAEGEIIGYSSYLNGLKEMMRDRYLWEIYSIPVSKDMEDLKNLHVMDSPILDWEYTKSLYLLHELANELKDKELIENFDKEINYLNSNANDVIDRNRKIIFKPEANLLELVELGLDNKYLSFINDYEVKESFGESLEFEDPNKEYALIGEYYYSPAYRNISQYADYYRIFSKYNYTDLAKYSYDQMTNIYNMSDYKAYGLCSIAYSTMKDISPEELSNILDPLLNNSKTELIEGNLYELILCKNVLKSQDLNVEILDESVDNLIKTVTLKMEDISILVREMEGADLNTDEVVVILSYNTVDVLMYLLFN